MKLKKNIKFNGKATQTSLTKVIEEITNSPQGVTLLFQPDSDDMIVSLVPDGKAFIFTKDLIMGLAEKAPIEGTFLEVGYRFFLKKYPVS